jgi:hypothetical protein
MLNAQQTLSDGTVDHIYDEVNRTGYKTVRSDASQDVTSPNLLVVSHEEAKSGRVNTVAYLDYSRIVDLDTNQEDNVRTQFKFSYNPKLGFPNIEAIVTEQIAQLQSFLTAANVAKLFNKES